MAYTSVPITPGSGRNIAVDVVGGVEFQREKLTIGGEGEAFGIDNGQQVMAQSLPVAIASDQSPVQTRPSSAGVGAHYDSGLQLVPGALTDLQTATVYIDRIFLVNITDQTQTITIRNRTGPTAYLEEYPLPPRTPLVLELGGMISLGGITWGAGAASAINSQIRGNL